MDTNNSKFQDLFTDGFSPTLSTFPQGTVTLSFYSLYLGFIGGTIIFY